MKWSKEFVFFLLHMAALNSLTLFKTYIRNQNQKAKAVLSRTSYLTVFLKWQSYKREKMREDGADDESLVSTHCHNIYFEKRSWIVTCIDVKNEFMLPAFFAYIL